MLPFDFADDCPAVAIDFETANELRTSACSIGVAWIENGRVTATEEHLIRPREMRFNPFNSAIHGIRADDVADAPEFPAVWARLRDRVEGRLVLAHNAAFDLSVLRHTLTDYGLDWPACSYLCTVVLARRAWPGLTAHKLNHLADFLGIALDHHHAGSDAEACRPHRAGGDAGIGAVRVVGDHQGDRHRPWGVDAWRLQPVQGRSGAAPSTGGGVTVGSRALHIMDRWSRNLYPPAMKNALRA